MIDLIIRNAQLFDGSRNAPIKADLAIAAGVISALGKDLGAARETIDGTGLALMPGIIDNHTHYDAQITWDTTLASSVALGVTSAVIGNCGFTIAPCRPADRELTMRNLTQVEGMAIDVLRQGIVWDFESIPDYLGRIAERGSVPNIAAFAGHSSLRTFVMGADATRRAASADEIARMKALLREAIDAGAIGFATCPRAWLTMTNCAPWSECSGKPGAACSCSPRVDTPVSIFWRNWARCRIVRW